MKTIKKTLLFLFIFHFSLLIGQQKKETKKIILSGKIIEKNTSLPLEYATITIRKLNDLNPFSGGISDNNGNFTIELDSGVYDINFEFISYKSIEIKAKNLISNTNLGTIALEDDAQQLEAVEIRSERTTLDIKLDKKVFNVGTDLIVRGGTVSDVLGNIPSVAVGAEGEISLRGNENVKILIDGKPTNAVNVAEALKMISADAISKVEVITNPSARYDAEGGGGIINIILKKGGNTGTNGSIIATIGDPENSSITTNINYKMEGFNVFSTLGVSRRRFPGNAKINQENFDKNRVLTSYIEERRDGDKLREGININFGFDWSLSKNTSWTNAINYNTNTGGNTENVLYYNYDKNRLFTNTRQRYNDLKQENESVEYVTNFITKFKKEGHELKIDGVFSENRNPDNSSIEGVILETNQFVSSERTKTINKQNRNLIQVDYVLPIKKDTQFEAGFRGNYLDLLSDYQVEERKTKDSPFTNIEGFTNVLDYREKVNAFYTQFGTKISKFSFLFGLRFEDSNIQVNQLTSKIFITKKYNNFFPSAFFTYEINEQTNLSLNYSKRINRPRERFINPFASYTSNVNLFQGNPDINPALTDAFDIGFLKKWENLTLNSSLYINNTNNSFQFVRKERGDEIDGIPVIINTPFNLAKEERIGYEMNINYSIKKWWKLTASFNFFNAKTKGEYIYTNTKNEVVVQDFNFKANSWFTQFNSKLKLPYKIDCQVRFNYTAPRKYNQGVFKGNASGDLAFSKDFFKEKGTLALNVRDVFNSQKRIQDLQLPNVNSYSEMQWRVRSISLSFTYRFNKKKTEKERSSHGGNNEEGGIE